MTMNESKSPLFTAHVRLSIVAAIFAYMLLMRLLPYVLIRTGVQLEPGSGIYAWNFSPVLAVCLFSGAFCTSSRMSAVLPLTTFFLGDLGIWALTGRLDWAFYPSQIVVYSCLIVCATLGFSLRETQSVKRVAGAGLAGCIVFFVATNFAVWALGSTYPKSPSGLATCYIAAIPYFRNSLLGTAVFSAILFSPLCLPTVSKLSILRRESDMRVE